MARRRDYRDPDQVRSINMRMGDIYVDRLDELCDINDRSRRVIVEMLIDKAHDELRRNPAKRITP